MFDACHDHSVWSACQCSSVSCKRFKMHYVWEDMGSSLPQSRYMNPSKGKKTRNFRACNFQWDAVEQEFWKRLLLWKIMIFDSLNKISLNHNLLFFCFSNLPSKFAIVSKRTLTKGIWPICMYSLGSSKFLKYSPSMTCLLAPFLPHFWQNYGY